MTEHQILIRPSTDHELEQLMELDNLIWNASNSPNPDQWDSIEDYQKRYPAGSQHVAIIDNRVAGYIMFKPPTSMESNQHVIDIAIGVHPNFQGKGVGRHLIEYVYTWGKSHGKKKISLRVMATNFQAIAFYRAVGFKEEGRLIDEFLMDGKYVDDILMYRMIE